MGASVRFIVTGSRDWQESWLVWEELDQYLAVPDLVIVHGQCPSGVDLFASQWCEEKGVKQEKHPIVEECVYHGWQHSIRLHGPKAGPIRNKVMVDLGAVMCLAFPKGPSHGTRGTIDLVRAASIPLSIREGVL